MNNALTPEHITRRLELLDDFRRELVRLLAWERGQPSHEDEIRSAINRRLQAARAAVEHAGALRLICQSRPPAAGGGMMLKNVDPFSNLFTPAFDFSFADYARDAVDEAIGYYETLIADPELLNVRTRESLDIETAIERALRPSFRRGPPEREVEVQDAIEDILNTLGVKFTREREATSVGGKAFKPDFVIEEHELALEVKLAKDGHGVAQIQEELAADVAAYGTKWKRSMFVVYDLGTIANPHEFRLDNLRKLGVVVLVVKH